MSNEAKEWNRRTKTNSHTNYKNGSDLQFRDVCECKQCSAMCARAARMFAHYLTKFATLYTRQTNTRFTQTLFMYINIWIASEQEKTAIQRKEEDKKTKYWTKTNNNRETQHNIDSWTFIINVNPWNVIREDEYVLHIKRVRYN